MTEFDQPINRGKSPDEITEQEYADAYFDPLALYIAATACCTALGFLFGYLTGASA